MKDTLVTLGSFCYREREEAIKILQAWQAKGLPDDFLMDGVELMANNMTGYVFLTNSDYQVAMMNGDSLESWYSCSYCDEEGFKEDCILNDNGCETCHPKASS